jgi:hypothetical protein
MGRKGAWALVAALVVLSAALLVFVRPDADPDPPAATDAPAERVTETQLVESVQEALGPAVAEYDADTERAVATASADPSFTHRTTVQQVSCVDTSAPPRAAGSTWDCTADYHFDQQSDDPLSVNNTDVEDSESWSVAVESDGCWRAVDTDEAANRTLPEEERVPARIPTLSGCA